MEADLVVFVLSHELDPADGGNKVDEEHDQEELHEWILISIQIAIAVRKGHLSLDQKVNLLQVELLLVLTCNVKGPVVRNFHCGIVSAENVINHIGKILVDFFMFSKQEVSRKHAFFLDTERLIEVETLICRLSVENHAIIDCEFFLNRFQ